MTACLLPRWLALALALLGWPAHAGQPIGARARALISAAGPRACVVLDIDNTLADTRYRTRAAAEAFARLHPGARALAGLRVGQIGWNGCQTALGVGLDRGLAGQFQIFWRSFFRTGRSFEHDRPMRASIELARAAKRAGAEVFYLSGRHQGLERATLRELARLGLPDVDAAHVICKPAGEKTTSFKRRSLKKLAASGRRPAWFLSDAVAELRAVSDLVPCLAVDFPVQPPNGPALPRGTPRLRYGRR